MENRIEDDLETDEEQAERLGLAPKKKESVLAKNPIFEGISPELLAAIERKVEPVALLLSLPENRTAYETAMKAMIVDEALHGEDPKTRIRAAEAALEAVKAQPNVNQFVNIFGREVMASIA